MSSQEISVACVTSDGCGASEFTEKTIILTGEQLRRLSEPIDAVNFRLRSSSSDYRSDFHVAGDPTLLVILTGSVRLTLANGCSMSFSPGQMFIAEDYLEPGIEFQQGLHGHMAEVTGGKPLTVLHLKLRKR